MGNFFSSVGGWFSNSWDVYYNNGVFNNGVYDIDPVGVLVLGVHLLITLLYFLWVWLRKTLRRWGSMDPGAAGMFRLAAARGDIKKLQDIKKGLWRFDINAKVDDGWTALHSAACMGQADAAAWLLANGADLHAKKDDSWGDTVLHYAAASGSVKCVQALLAAGAEPKATNFAGLAPADYAALNNHTDVVALLARAGGSSGGSGGGGAANGGGGGGAGNGGAQVQDGRPPSATLQGLREGDTFYNQYAAQAARTQTAAETAASSSTEEKQRLRRRLRAICSRGYEGAGTPGTVRAPGTRRFRALGVLSTVLGAVYLMWRAARSLSGGWLLFYSIPLFTCEYLGWILWTNSVIGLWCTIDRVPRNLGELIPEEEFPSIDVYIVAYNEPVDVIEPTTIAALNMNYPPDKLTVYILDDGKRPEVRSCAMRLDFQNQYFKRSARLCYLSREKVMGVPHHAKAGNINHALLKGGVVRGQYVLVLDCDMLVHPDFLVRSMGHMYRKDMPSGKWLPKDKVGFLQTPQDFWNLERKDPLFHCNTWFFGPCLKGRDGLNATPCAGTGVVFKRDVLVSIGGQAYGSVTEDFNTSMHLLKSGFANMYLDSHMTFGMAPEDVPSTFSQRLRWAMGAIQVYFRNNPLKISGLSHIQSLLFWDVCFSHFTALAIIFVSIVPIVYIFANISPIRLQEGHMWEFTLFFLAYYVSNRVTLWWAFMGARNGMHNLWRATQQCVWLAPNHCKAVWKVMRTEVWFLRWTSRFEIGFAVTSKGQGGANTWRHFKDTLKCVWPFLLYYGIALGALIFIFVTLRHKDAARILGELGAWGWVALTMMGCWPPLYTLLPRVYTDNGWKVEWRALRGGGGTAAPTEGEVEMAPQQAAERVEAIPLTGPSAPPLRRRPSRQPSLSGGDMDLDGPGGPHSNVGAAGGVSGGSPPGGAAGGGGLQHTGSMPRGLRHSLRRQLSGAVAIDVGDGGGSRPQEVMSNFGRVGVGAEHLRSLRRQNTMEGVLPSGAAHQMRSELASLYHDVMGHLMGRPSAMETAAAAAYGTVPPQPAAATDATDVDGGDGVGVSAFALHNERFPQIFYDVAEPLEPIRESNGAIGDGPLGAGVAAMQQQQQQRQTSAQRQGSMGTTYSLGMGGLQLRIQPPAYDVDTAHDPRGRGEVGASVGRYGAPAHVQRREVSPQVLAAVRATANGRLNRAPSAAQQWVTADAVHANGGATAPAASVAVGGAAAVPAGEAQFVPLGGGDRALGVPLLAEALEHALQNGRTEREREHDFIDYLVSRAGAPAPTNPSAAAAANAMAGIAEGAGEASAGAVGFTAGGTAAPVPACVAQGVVPDPKVLAQPDFANRQLPPRSYTFAVVFGLLVVGLVVAGILDASGVMLGDAASSG